VDEQFFKEIYKRHIQKLENLLVPHEKLMICFSGIAGSGKTYIAKILEEKYKGVRIKNDDIRKIVATLDKTQDIDEATYGYFDWFFKNYSFKNGLVILDRGVDRGYKEVLPFFKDRGYKVFIIRLKVSEEVYERRIKDKLGKLDENYINRIDDWKRQYKEFGKAIKPDIVIENEKDNELDLGPLFNRLDALVR
jgi:predicted kinase